MVVAAIVVLASGLVLWRSWTEAQRIIHPERHPVDRSLGEFGLVHEDVEFTTEDGLRLKGWFVPPGDDSRATVIVQSGYSGSRESVITNTAALARHGYGVLSFDWRATGESEGETATVGLHEVRDVVAARQWLRGRTDVDQSRVGALGQSAGAAAIIMAAAEDPSIAAIVAETTFASLEDMMHASIEKKTGLSSFPFADLITLFGQLEAGARLTDVRPVDVIGRISPRPVFLIRGGDDKWVPAYNADLLMEAAGEPKLLWDAPRSKHSRVILAHPEEYELRVVDFFDRYLKGKAGATTG